MTKYFAANSKVAPLFRKYNACKCDLVLYNANSILMIDTMRQEIILMIVVAIVLVLAM